MISRSACIENLSRWLWPDQPSGLYSLYCVHHRGKWVSLITEWEHNRQRHPSRNEGREVGPTRLSTPNGGHRMHHHIRDALHSASAVALLPGRATGGGVSAKATGSEVGVVG